MFEDLADCRDMKEAGAREFAYLPGNLIQHTCLHTLRNLAYYDAGSTNELQAQHSHPRCVSIMMKKQP